MVGLDGLFMHVVDLVDTFLELLRLSTGYSFRTLLAKANKVFFNSLRCST